MLAAAPGQQRARGVARPAARHERRKRQGPGETASPARVRAQRAPEDRAGLRGHAGVPGVGEGPPAAAGSASGIVCAGPAPRGGFAGAESARRPRGDCLMLRHALSSQGFGELQVRKVSPKGRSLWFEKSLLPHLLSPLLLSLAARIVLRFFPSPPSLGILF